MLSGDDPLWPPRRTQVPPPHYQNQNPIEDQVGEAAGPWAVPPYYARLTPLCCRRQARTLPPRSARGELAQRRCPHLHLRLTLEEHGRHVSAPPPSPKLQELGLEGRPPKSGPPRDLSPYALPGCLQIHVPGQFPLTNRRCSQTRKQFGAFDHHEAASLACLHILLPR